MGNIASQEMQCCLTSPTHTKQPVAVGQNSSKSRENQWRRPNSTGGVTMIGVPTLNGQVGAQTGPSSTTYFEGNQGYASTSPSDGRKSRPSPLNLNGQFAQVSPARPSMEPYNQYQDNEPPAVPSRVNGTHWRDENPYPSDASGRDDLSKGDAATLRATNPEGGILGYSGSDMQKSRVQMSEEARKLYTVINVNQGSSPRHVYSGSGRTPRSGALSPSALSIPSLYLAQPVVPTSINTPEDEANNFSGNIQGVESVHVARRSGTLTSTDAYNTTPEMPQQGFPPSKAIPEYTYYSNTPRNTSVGNGAAPPPSYLSPRAQALQQNYSPQAVLPQSFASPPEVITPPSTTTQSISMAVSSSSMPLQQPINMASRSKQPLAAPPPLSLPQASPRNFGMVRGRKEGDAAFRYVQETAL